MARGKGKGAKAGAAGAAKPGAARGAARRAAEGKDDGLFGAWRLALAALAGVGLAMLLKQQGFTSEDLREAVNSTVRALSGTPEVERRAPEVELMPASAAAEYGVAEAADLPFVSYLPGPPLEEREERPMGARFRSFYPYDLTMWWDNGTPEGVYSGVLRAMGDSATNTYTTHRFKFRRKDTNEDVAVLEMRDDRHLMLLGPAEDDKETLESKAYQDTLAEQAYMKEYFDRTGQPWLAYYPPVKPALPFWPADFIGQVHQVRSFVGYFSSETEQSSEPVDLKLKVVSTHPRVLLIENLLSPFEVDFIIKAGLKVVRRSSVGSASDGFESDTRTSDNGWLSRYNSNVLNTVYKRFADALRMPDELMREGTTYKGGNLEQLQFVRYKRGQKYEPHHDFGNSGGANQRFSTLFIYLQTPEEGGATSFPKAQPRGIMVKPPPGSAALFYSMTEDGNGDDLSLHSGMEVTKGEKLGCNLWSWSPSYDTTK